VPPPGTKAATQQQQQQAGAVAAAGIAAALAPAEAWAKGGGWGPLEGKVSSLVHPVAMACLFFTTLYTGFLGWQWRQTRLISGELSDLRKTLPKTDPEAAPTEPSSAVKAIQAQISELDSRRKELTQGGYKDKHFATSSILLGGGVFFTAWGVYNTWFRADKLFPGPHVYAGTGIVVLWALSAALVPWMAKGNETARTAHIALNVLNVLLFCWQLPTGLEIAQKVLGLNIPLF